MRFDNRVAVITGVGREGQVGEAIARGFAERGALVVLVDRQPMEVSQRAAALKAAGFRAWGYTADLTDPQQVDEVARRTAAAHAGQVDILVNAAGGFAGGRIAESDVSVVQRQLAVNLVTAYLTTRAFLPLVRAAKGSVLYFGSEAALPEGRAAGMGAYAAAKAGVLALMRCVAQEERENGVRANALAPGAVRTTANVQAGGDAGPFVEREDVVQAVLYLCSPKARAVTGQVLRLEAMGTRDEGRGKRDEGSGKR
jgi:NAD(P)-dependent dehydrogenase (short-subunit alcohol dehydrogenase family)